MHMKIIFIAQLLVFLIYHSYALAVTTIEVGSDLGPPHMFLDKGHARGIDIDVVRHLLAKLDIEANFHFVGLARARKEVIAGKLDAVVPTFIQQNEDNLYISVPIISYLPTVFSLAENHYSPLNLGDLIKHSVVSFQGATGYFGGTFQEVAQGSPYYLELSNMQNIPRLVAKNRFDYAVLDKYIFYYYFRQAHNMADVSIFREHSLIAPAYAGIGFSNKFLRDEFNLVAKGFLESDEYKKVVARYIGKVK